MLTVAQASFKSENLRRRVAVEINRAGSGVSAIQGALWPLEDFNTIEVM